MTESETEVETQESTPTPSNAFQVLGNEVRMSIVQALLETEEEPGVLSFSELFERSKGTNTAGFAYHLRQLTGHYLRKTEEGYAFTYAGLKIARAIVAGTYSESVDLDPVVLDEKCPFCAETALEARGADNYLSIECRDCDRPVLTLPFSPEGYRAHGEDLAAAFDRQHRYRLSLMADGHCPECGGRVEAAVAPPPERVKQHLPDDAVSERVQLQLACERCGYRLRCPTTLAVLEHPAVISFYYDHGADVRDRPVWNVGSEWRETLLSEDPWCMRVSTRLDDDVLALYVDRNATVVDVQYADA